MCECVCVSVCVCLCRNFLSMSAVCQRFRGMVQRLSCTRDSELNIDTASSLVCYQEYIITRVYNNKSI